jgi:hypothetical protein
LDGDLAIPFEHKLTGNFCRAVLEEYGYLATEPGADIIETLKEERHVMIRSAVTYYDEPDEEESPEAFRERMQDLVERWKSLLQTSEQEVGDT